MACIFEILLELIIEELKSFEKGLITIQWHERLQRMSLSEKDIFKQFRICLSYMVTTAMGMGGGSGVLAALCLGIVYLEENLVNRRGPALLCMIKGKQLWKFDLCPKTKTPFSGLITTQSTDSHSVSLI